MTLSIIKLGKLSLMLLLLTFAVPSHVTTANSVLSVQATDRVVYLSIIWHQHQPNYQDPSTGIYEQPWVYMHSTDSYPWMADLHKNHPNVNATINITPSLLSQMDDYVAGTAFDRRMEVAKMDEASMSDENKTVVLRYFFDINPQFVTGRYAYLQNKSNENPTMSEKLAAFTDGDILDLKVMFYLRWINQEYRRNDFVLNLLDNDIDTKDPSQPMFVHNNLVSVLDKGLQLVQSVVQRHRDARTQGNLEVITTPFYHPILPLLIDLDSARESPGNTNLPLPTNNTLWTEDAQAQIDKGVLDYTNRFGDAPRGMWPSEESVSKAVIPLMDNAGVEWFVSDQHVLQNSLSVSELSPEQQYQMYKTTYNGHSIASVYRDTALSDKIGFSYSGMDPDAAAQDFIDELHNRYDSLATAPTNDYLITVALDGENAWEHYTYDIDGDGKNEYTGDLFRNKLYDKIEEAQTAGWLKTVTPAQYLDAHPLNTLPEITNLASGSWISGEFNTWIGEPDENIAWEWLIDARSKLVEYEGKAPLPNQNLTAAWEAVYKAEGSDWFWWYGADQDSGHDEEFDWGYKTFLRNIYENIGFTQEEILAINPLLYLRLKPGISANFPAKMSNYAIDGQAGPSEWDASFMINDSVAEKDAINYHYSGVNENLTNLLFRVDLAADANRLTSTDFLAFYLSDPRASIGDIFPIGVDRSNISNTLGFKINFAVTYNFNDSSLHFWKSVNNIWTEVSGYSGQAAYASVFEAAIPLEFFNFTGGDFFSVSTVYFGTNADVSPDDGRIIFQVPFSGVDFNVIYEMSDPVGDEYGDYPTAPAFEPFHGIFDILNFKVGYDDDNFVVSMQFGEITNPWNAPSGFSHPIIQVYIDKDRVSGSGNMQPDQNPNVLIHEDFAWETLVRADGWLKYGQFENKSEFGGVNAIADLLEKRITITAPLSAVGMPTDDWAYVVLVGSQDYQAYRDRLTDAQTWKLGGGDDGPYDPNVIDMLVPEGVNQTDILSSYSVADQLQAKVIGVGPKVNYGIDSEAPIVAIDSPTDNAAFTLQNDKVDVTVTFTATDNAALDHYDLFLGNILLLDNQNLINGSNTVTVTVTAADVIDSSVTIRINVYDGHDETKANLGFATVSIKINTSGNSNTNGGFLPAPTIITSLGILAVAINIYRKKK